MAACDHPARTPVAQPTSTVATPLRSADGELPITDYDTLHAGGRVLRARPATQAVFNHAYSTVLPAVATDTLDAPAIAVAGKVRRAGLHLFLQAANGAQVTVTDDTTATPEACRYRYWGAAKQLHQWVLDAGFWEGSGVALIDQRTGQRTNTWGQPIASPGGRFFLAASADLRAEYNPNGLQLYQLTAAGPRLLWQRQFGYWEPREVRWLDNHTVLIYQAEGPTGSDREPREGFLQLDLTPLLTKTAPLN